MEGSKRVIERLDLDEEKREMERRRNRNLANVTVFTLLLGVFEGGQASSINGGHFEIGEESEDPMRSKP